jgi:hypothetical protein
MAKKIKGVPLNLNKRGCTAISSNCITWQGPDIPCLDLCKGATVSEVIYNLGLEFCKLYEDLSPENYNIDCLKLDNVCDVTFRDIFQALIDKACASQPFYNYKSVFGETFTDSSHTASYNTLNTYSSGLEVSAGSGTGMYKITYNFYTYPEDTGAYCTLGVRINGQGPVNSHIERIFTIRDFTTSVFFVLQLSDGDTLTPVFRTTGGTVVFDGGKVLIEKLV